MTKLSPQFSHFCARLWRTSRLRLSKVAVNFSWHQHIRPRLNNHNFGNTWFSSLKVFSVLVQKVQNSSDLCHSQFWILAAFSIFADLPADSHLLENVYFFQGKIWMKYTYKQIAAHVSFLGCLMPLSYTYSSSIVLCHFVQRANNPYISGSYVCHFWRNQHHLQHFLNAFAKSCFHSDISLCEIWICLWLVELEMILLHTTWLPRKTKSFWKRFQAQISENICQQIHSIFVNKYTWYF